MDAFTQPHRHGRRAAAVERRHRPDHPGCLPEAGDAHGFRGRPVRRLAQRPGLRAQPARVQGRDDPGRRPRVRHRLVSRARRVGAAEPRLPGRALVPFRRHLPGQRRARAGWSPPPCQQPDIEALWAAIDADPTTAVTVDLESRTVSWGGRSVQLRDRRLHPLAPAGRPRRHRPDVAPCRRDRSSSSRTDRPGCRNGPENRRDTRGNCRVRSLYRHAFPPNVAGGSSDCSTRDSSAKGFQREQGSADRQAVHPTRQQEGRDGRRRRRPRHHHPRRGRRASASPSPASASSRRSPARLARVATRAPAPP